MEKWCLLTQPQKMMVGGGVSENIDKAVAIMTSSSRDSLPIITSRIIEAKAKVQFILFLGDDEMYHLLLRI